MGRSSATWTYSTCPRGLAPAVSFCCCWKFGIGNDFPRGAQADFVLGKFSSEDEDIIAKQLPTACDIAKSFCLAGITITMNQFNKKGAPSNSPKGENSKTTE